MRRRSRLRNPRSERGRLRTFSGTSSSAFRLNPMPKPPLPLTVWRIGDRSFPIFSAYGAMHRGGRWNSPGIAVIYASSTLAGAMLEVRAHTNGVDPPDQSYISIHLPDGVSVERVNRRDVKGWRHASCQASRQFGDQWASDARSCILIVPSAVCPAPSFNVLINPLHPDFGKITTSKPKKLRWDRRLFS